MSARSISLIVSPAASVLLYAVLRAAGLDHSAAATGALALCCAIWWVLEPLPVPITALLPLAGLPLLGISTPSDIAQAYGNPLILLMLGGAMLSQAMASSGAHLRIALGLLHLFGGGSLFRLVFGFMLAAALLSMWISNTATALMLLPVALALTRHADKALALPLLLAVAYGCSIGGLGTPIGTPPNLIFLDVYRDTTGHTIGFLAWMWRALPVVVLMLPLAAWWLTRGVSGSLSLGELPPVGPMQSQEKRVLAVLAVTACAWMTMEDPFGGWRHWFNLPHASYGSVALLAIIALFVCPAGTGNRRLLSWDEARGIEWGILLLFAGGIALAQAFVDSGLSSLLAAQLAVLANLPLWLMLLLLCVCVTLMSELTSNTATATLLMPILAATAGVLGMEPMLLMLPAALCASCAFMLPVATPPNAVVFASGQIQVKQMARKGFVLNLACALTCTVVALLWQ